MTTLSMDMERTRRPGIPPSTGFWPAPEEDHKVLYEDEAIRVISVSIAPERDRKAAPPLVARRCFIVDRLVRLRRDFNGATGEEIALPIPKGRAATNHREISASAAPLCREPRATRPFHATRIEFKHGFPTAS